MLILKLLIKYTVVITITGFLGGILLHYLHPILFNVFYNPTPKIQYSIQTGLGTSFIIYISYQFLLLETWNLKTRGLFIRAIFCYLLVVFLSVLLGLSTFGYNITGFLYVSLSLGFSNFLLPYIDNYLNKILKSNEYYNKQ